MLEEPERLLNTAITLVGRWESYKGKPTFAFSGYELKGSQLYFFLTRMVGGIPAGTAKQIVQALGDEIATVLESCPEKLLQFRGIGPVRLEKIKERWQKFAKVRQLAETLLPFGLSNALILRIAEHFGEAALSVVSEDPYRLTEVRGIGFKTADEIALKLGMAKDDPRRVGACLRHCLEEHAEQTGHTVLSWPELGRKVQEKIEGLPEPILFQVAQEELARGRLVEAPEETLTLPWLAKAERAIFETVCRFQDASGPIVADIKAWVSAFERRCGLVLGEKQRLAVELANTAPPILIVCGYAGTGKTTTARAILELYRMRHSKIVCCALSGVAANRVGQKTGFPASTIHALLGYDGRQFAFNAKTPLPYEVVLLDEASMVDSVVFHRLLAAIDFARGARLVLLGDPAQLPPVGPGEPFADLLEYDLVPNVELDRIYRQREDQVIALFASEVRSGKVPFGYRRQEFSDFAFQERSIPNYFKLRRTLPEKALKALREDCHRKILQDLIALAKAHAPTLESLWRQKRISEYLTHFQVLSPRHKGELGTETLNLELQAVLNPTPALSEARDLTVGNRSFRVRDKVIHLVNSHLNVVLVQEYRSWLKTQDEALIATRRVFNGQLGVVIRLEKEAVHVLYPNEGYVALYDKLDLANWLLDLAYCLTVHKAQGSEFEHVAMPMTTSHWAMLTPKLIYTAITRAKTRLTLIGQPYAFEMGIARDHGERRTSRRRTLIGLLAGPGIESPHA